MRIKDVSILLQENFSGPPSVPGLEHAKKARENQAGLFPQPDIYPRFEIAEKSLVRLLVV